MLCAQYFGKGDKQTVERIIGLAARVAILISLLFFAFSFFAPEAIMKIFSDSPQTIKEGAAYLKVLSFSFVFMGFSQVFVSALRSVGKIVFPSALYVVSLLVNVLMNAAFIFGLFGLPRLGVVGVAPVSYTHLTGEAIKNWLINTEIDGYKGFEWVLVNYLGFSDDQVKEWESQKDVYLNIEGGMWGGLYVGSHHTGAVLVGSVTSWAKFTSSNNYISRYSHGNMPNSMVYDQSWLGLSVPSNISSKHSSADILAPVGYGIVSVRPVLGDRQVIKCYYTAGKLDNMSYSFADESYEIKDEGSYKAKDWFVSEKKSNRSGDTEFSSFQSELASTRTYA